MKRRMMRRTMRRMKRRREALGFLAAAGLFAATAGVEAGVKLIERPDGSKYITNSGSAGPPRTVAAVVTRGTAQAPPARARVPRSDIEPLIERYAKRRGLDEDLVRAVVQAESAFDPSALSRKGAMGLMQLMPGTARELSVEDPYDPEDNLRAGTLYLDRMLDLFGGRLEPALAAYNAGPEAVRRFDGVPPYPETRAYVEKVMRLYQGRPGYTIPRAGRASSGGRKTYVYRDADGRLMMSNRP